MELAQQFPTRHPLETEDLVARFVEDELGRHDWASNWAAYKTQYPNYLDRIRNFFHRQGDDDINPETVVRHIDNMIISRPGRWR